MTDDKDPGLAPTGIVRQTLPSLPTGAGAAVDMPNVIADRYEILALLGAGGMGRVYRAHDRKLDELVALKVLRRELLDTAGVLDRFRQEVKLARRVTSVHVVRTFDLGQHGDDHFLTMEYVEGQSLARLLEERAPELDEVLHIARAACLGIAAAHQAGVLHRDLKPDNVLVAKTGRIAITDFGIARPSSGVTATIDRFAGTPAYMAPEQVEGKFAIGPQSDVYAFGAIVFEMLTGRRPFPGTDMFAVALARLHEPPPDPRAFRPVPDVLATLVLRCLARDPDERFRDASALGTALAAIQQLPAAPAASRPLPLVPAKTSLAVAVLPLRAVPELAEVALGLTEEIVDSLSMTRALRIRPLMSVRRAGLGDLDPREVGQALGVDVVVDGSIRRAGEVLRIAARAISVGDGFQLWANRFETRADNLLSASDEIARAVAHALTVEIAMPVRKPSDARATELYLEGKARLRLVWTDGDLSSAMRSLDEALQLAPDDPNILAANALVLARAAFYGAQGGLPRARVLAERAIVLAPSSGEPWLAVGLAALYSAAYDEAARALLHAVAVAPGLAQAQATLGAIALESGLLDDAIAHLEAAFALDPTGSQGPDLARAYIYAGRRDEAFALLARTEGHVVFTQTTIARFRMWAGERHDFTGSTANLFGDFGEWADIMFRVHRTQTLLPEDTVALSRIQNATNPRLRGTRAQFTAELQLFVGDREAALESIGVAVAAGLQDHLWFERCPILDPLRESPRFRELAAIVAERARRVQDVVRARPQ